MSQIGRASPVCLLAAAACSGSNSPPGIRPANPSTARAGTHSTRPAVRKRPAGWDTPTDTGELAIYDDGTAKFTSHAGHVATFVKLPEKPTLTGCD